MPRKTTEKDDKKRSKTALNKEKVDSVKEPKKVPAKNKTAKQAKNKIDNHSQKVEKEKKVTTKKEITITNPTGDDEFILKLFRLVTTNPKQQDKKQKKITTKKKSTQLNSPVLEYYDLPYRYNETVVKLLAQTPNILFVYWDVSDQDRDRFIQEYGTDFFQNSKPVLVVHNKTKNYSFEIEINDFANSWYIQVDDTKCDYLIELGRRPKNAYVHFPNNYLYITSSNQLESPNDHILFENIQSDVVFQNAKTRQVYTKRIPHMLTNSGKKLVSIYEIYQAIYGKELVTFDDRIDFSNPSSNPGSNSFLAK